MHRSLIWTFILILFLAGCRAQGSFKPERATATPGGDLVRRPVVASFAELDQDPRAYQNRLIRVSGAFLQLPALPCTDLHGPLPRWALSDGELRLDGRGFERILRLLPEGIELTVDGFWHFYKGPVGCGKEPPVDTIWYLEAVRLVQPNPLPGLDGLLAPDSPRATVEPLPTLGPDETATSTATPSNTPTATATVTGTPPTATPTPSATAPGTALTPTRQVTPTPSVTARPGGTSTLTPTPTPTATSGPGGASTPTQLPPTSTDEPPETPGPTATPGGYPNPTPTPDPYD